MKHKDEERVEVSLIPEIRQQERRLQQALQATRAEAERLVLQARQKTEAALEEMQQGVSASVDRLYTDGIQALQASHESRRARIRDSLRGFEQQTETRLSQAVQQIMRLVLPEEPA